MVVDERNRVAADTISFTTPPLPSVSCRVIDNILRCNSNNPIARQLCQFNSDSSSVPCSSPFNIIDHGLTVGQHSLKVTIVDVFERTQTVLLDFSIISNLTINCIETEETPSVLQFDCHTSGGIGDVTYACSIDGEDCKWHLTN